MTQATTTGKYFAYGYQYYITARYAARAGLRPVSGNLFHLAIEMLLKGYLSKTHSVKEMKKLDHHLPSIWKAFKQTLFEVQKSPYDLSPFDDLIEALQPFKNIRYPEELIKKGMSSTISWEATPIILPTNGIKKGETPIYNIYVSALDKLVDILFTTCGVPASFYQVMLNPFAHKHLEEDYLFARGLTST